MRLPRASYMMRLFFFLPDAPEYILALLINSPFRRCCTAILLIPAILSEKCFSGNDRDTYLNNTKDYADTYYAWKEDTWIEITDIKYGEAEQKRYEILNGPMHIFICISTKHIIKL